MSLCGIFCLLQTNRLTGTFSKARFFDEKDHGTKLIFKIPELRNRKVFQGKNIALTNGKSFSNGSMTAAALKKFANATLVDSETASRYMRFAENSQERLQLP